MPAQRSRKYSSGPTAQLCIVEKCAARGVCLSTESRRTRSSCWRRKTVRFCRPQSLIIFIAPRPHRFTYKNRANFNSSRLPWNIISSAHFVRALPEIWGTKNLPLKILDTSRFSIALSHHLSRSEYIVCRTLEATAVLSTENGNIYVLNYSWWRKSPISTMERPSVVCNDHWSLSDGNYTLFCGLNGRHNPNILAPACEQVC